MFIHFDMNCFSQKIWFCLRWLTNQGDSNFRCVVNDVDKLQIIMIQIHRLWFIFLFFCRFSSIMDVNFHNFGNYSDVLQTVQPILECVFRCQTFVGLIVFFFAVTMSCWSCYSWLWVAEKQRTRKIRAKKKHGSFHGMKSRIFRGKNLVQHENNCSKTI